LRSEPIERQAPFGVAAILNRRGLGTIVALPAASRFIYRGVEAASRCGEVFGIELPRVACRAAVSGQRAALWLGPDEWLLIAPEDEADAIGAQLSQALSSIPHSLVDISHRQIGIELTGTRMAPMLNAGCPLDLDLESFPVDRCTRTILAKAEMILWRRAPEVFHIEVWRSFAPYVAALLCEAAGGVTDQ
jgi:sarcosine oxidase subunit gamma